jgi:hypothetical protein
VRKRLERKGKRKRKIQPIHENEGKLSEKCKLASQ